MKSYTIFKLELFYKRIKPLSCWLSAKLGHATEADYILEKGKNRASVFIPCDVLNFGYKLGNETEMSSLSG